MIAEGPEASPVAFQDVEKGGVNGGFAACEVFPGEKVNLPKGFRFEPMVEKFNVGPGKCPGRGVKPVEPTVAVEASGDEGQGVDVPGGDEVVTDHIFEGRREDFPKVFFAGNPDALKLGVADFLHGGDGDNLGPVVGGLHVAQAFNPLLEK